jgi:IS5 family transposase
MDYIMSSIGEGAGHDIPRIPMRNKIHCQTRLPLWGRLPKVVKDYHAKYERISGILDDNPGILEAVHADLSNPCSPSGRQSTYSSEQFFRMIVVKVIEGVSLREVIVRVSESDFLRHFTRIFDGEIMSFSELDAAIKHIKPETWEKVNELLKRYAKRNNKITGLRLRVDSTVCETNIHYPTDASLLWDSFRVAARLMRQCIGEDASLSMGNRFHEKKVKRLYTFVSTHGGQKGNRRAVRRSMRELIGKVEWICGIGRQFVARVTSRGSSSIVAVGLAQELGEKLPLMEEVAACSRRVFNGETVPASDRIFSIFEPHTELLKRGKSRKPVEFGHMVTIGQTAEKFIGFYNVEEQSRHDIQVGDEALHEHKKTFGAYPEQFTADKNYYGGPEHLKKWEKRIGVYAVGKKGRRNEEETEREHGFLFKLLQKFRAGCEGSISVLKRVFGLYRCLFRSFKSFASSIGSTVFCHNLIVLSRL